jgi:hypothetical protein
MKEITLRVTEEMAQLVKQWAEHIPDMEVVATDDCDDSIEFCDQCLLSALATLRENKVIVHPYDFTWIMAAINQYAVDGIEGFRSSNAFVKYLKELGVEDVPCRDTVSSNINKVEDVYPTWTFSDTEEPYEVRRRRNVAIQFVAAYNKAKRQGSTGCSTK